MYPMLIESIVDNMNLSNREQIIEGLRQANQPNPQQAATNSKCKLQMDIGSKAQAIKNIQSQTAEVMSRVKQNAVETQMLPLMQRLSRICGK
jgi:hypothetical protein